MEETIFPQFPSRSNMDLLIYINIDLLGVQKSSELFFVKFNLYSYVIVRKWLAA